MSLIYGRINSLVDFTVDTDAISLRRFLTSAERMLTSDDIVLKHPDVDWSRQTQHLFRDNLRSAASTLIVSESGGSSRLIGFEEFNEKYDLQTAEALADLAKIFGRCKSNLTENPMFLVRVTGYAYVCSEHLKSKSAMALGFTARDLPIDEMVSATNDDHLLHGYLFSEKDYKQLLQRDFRHGSCR
jgi:hypothetical protein